MVFKDVDLGRGCFACLDCDCVRLFRELWEGTLGMIAEFRESIGTFKTMGVSNKLGAQNNECA